MRKFLIFLVVLIALIGGGLYWAFSNLDAWVEAAIESEGSKAAKATVEVGSVELVLQEGKGVINGLSVGNPKGFSSATAISLDEISLVVDPERSTQDVFVLKEFVVRRPIISYEVGGKGSNMKEIESSVGSYVDALGPQTTEPRFIIDKFVITKGEIKVLTKKDKLASSDLPGVTLRNIGANQGGVTGAELGEIIVSRLTDKAVSAATSGAVNKLLGDVLDKAFSKDD